MLSESARMSSAYEARFRVQAPNSRPRNIRVIALDEPSEQVVRQLAASAWSNAAFYTAAGNPRLSGGISDTESLAWFRVLDGAPADLIEVVETADLVIMIAAPGHENLACALIGDACSQKRVMTTALLVGSDHASDEALSKTLAQLRPWSLMVVIANTDDYIEDMLVALRGR